MEKFTLLYNPSKCDSSSSQPEFWPHPSFVIFSEFLFFFQWQLWFMTFLFQVQIRVVLVVWVIWPYSFGFHQQTLVSWTAKYYISLISEWWYDCGAPLTPTKCQQRAVKVRGPGAQIPKLNLRHLEKLHHQLRRWTEWRTIWHQKVQKIPNCLTSSLIRSVDCAKGKISSLDQKL